MALPIETALAATYTLSLTRLQCQVTGWKKNRLGPQAAPHKLHCPKLKVDMGHHPYVRSQLEQFPWGRVEKDGSFSDDIARARFGVLGPGATYGYWSVPYGGHALDANPGMIPNTRKNDHLLAPFVTQRGEDYVHGEVLLGESWPLHESSWKLKEKSHIPGLFYDEEVPPPSTLAPIVDWASWYQWRGIPLESPAAMLMHYPLTVYHLLNDILHVVETSGTERRKIRVHYLGAEVELNFIPLFSEIALLIPDADLDLTFFGKTTYDLVQRARRESPGSLATRDVVWEYTAPRKLGGSSLTVRLSSDSEAWGGEALQSHNPLYKVDAVIACNAGLGAYQTWYEPIVFCDMTNIPFAVTDYIEQSLRTAAEGTIPAWREFALRTFEFAGMPATGLASLRLPREYPITVNPFHKPGQRPMGGTRMPNMINGFAMPVVMRT
ncbi:hypothetical protein HGRIS_004205 [Hohenbuehelia grisea]|uniref:Mitochondrial splicing suppressor 51-like C-terminal domain-containing protein n=1 Tax=Hohenbuehelia grisea TaxID=104357 RepID=A0ABR3JHX8_9AGAR